MGNIATWGPGPEALESVNLDFSAFPPWVVVWTGLWLDILTKPVGLVWRNYVPMTGPGQWFSSEWSPHDVFARAEGRYISFAEFREESGTESLYNDLYAFLFQTPETTLQKLTTREGLITLGVLVILVGSIKSVIIPRFREVGKSLARQRHGEDWLKQPENQERIKKFGEYVFRLIYHSSISVYGFFYFWYWRAPWWDPSIGGTTNLWVDMVGDDGYQHPPWMIWYYLLQAAYNVEAMMELVEMSFRIRIVKKLPFVRIEWADTCRKDFNEMMIHHVVTNALIFLSGTCRFQRPGSMVFWMHDLSDIPIDTAKLANFLKYKTATAIFFTILVLVWIVTRLYVLPFIIWRSAYAESYIFLRKTEGLKDIDFYVFQPLFTILLGALVALHIFWFQMFINMGYVLIFKGKAVDYSEKHDNIEEHLRDEVPTETKKQQ